MLEIAYGPPAHVRATKKPGNTSAAQLQKWLRKGRVRRVLSGAGTT